ncbi:MAG: AAA family ATPase [Aphanizomenon gracile PMC649.10]|nr:AAA family ATPase [Aphanizomenon gracile PMC649.10]
MIELNLLWIGYKKRLVGIHLGNEELDLMQLLSIIEVTDKSSFNVLLKDVVKIVHKFDTGISKIEIKQKPEDSFGYNIYAVHNDSEGNEVHWSFEEESLGTQRIFNLAFRLVLVLNTGQLAVIDELGTNIHPNIVKYIIKMFQNPKTNPKNAQLIFTSHDNTLQRNNLLRRDQIWFTQKRPDHSTELYPLTDFHVRNDLAIDKAYLDGRFGAVPFLPSEEEMILQGDEECQES